MINKALLLKIVNAMPENIEVSDLVDRISLIQKIELGLQQSANDQVTPHEKIKTEKKDWFKSNS